MYFGCEPGAKSVDLPLQHEERYTGMMEQTALAFLFFFLPFFATPRLTLGALLETGLQGERITKQAWRTGGISGCRDLFPNRHTVF